MINILIALGILLLLCIAVMLVRAACFRPHHKELAAREEVTFDGDAAIAALQALIRCKTVSSYNREEEDDAEFEKLIDLLPTLYPEVFRACSFRRLPDRALLFCWKGQTSGQPAVLMAHYDVVPVDEAQWEKPPFEAIIEDGVLWGRGSLDTKVTFNGVLSAADHLIAQGFVPQNDIYFAFSGGEEVNGEGAVHIVRYFKENGITPSMVVDEGGAVVENVFPGVKQPCGLIGIAEKGMINLSFSIKTAGGHASAPLAHTPIGLLSKACAAVEDHPFPMHITKPTEEMFDTLGRHSTFLFRVIFANFRVFRGLLDLVGKKTGGEINALLRTTVAFTQASGSPAPNVIPTSASMVANLRLNPEDTVDSAVERIRKTVDDDRVELTVLHGENPSPVSRTDDPAFQKVATAVANTWQGCVVSPYLMMQCSDSRHYRDLSDRVYRFSAMDLTAKERRTIHGNNERVRLDCAKRAVEFYIRLMKQC